MVTDSIIQLKYHCCLRSHTRLVIRGWRTNCAAHWWSPRFGCLDPSRLIRIPKGHTGKHSNKINTLIMQDSFGDIPYKSLPEKRVVVRLGTTRCSVSRRPLQPAALEDRPPPGTNGKRRHVVLLA